MTMRVSQFSVSVKSYPIRMGGDTQPQPAEAAVTADAKTDTTVDPFFPPQDFRPPENVPAEALKLPLLDRILLRLTFKKLRPSDQKLYAMLDNLSEQLAKADFGSNPIGEKLAVPWLMSRENGKEYNCRTPVKFTLNGKSYEYRVQVKDHYGLTIKKYSLVNVTENITLSLGRQGFSRRRLRYENPAEKISIMKDGGLFTRKIKSVFNTVVKYHRQAVRKKRQADAQHQYYLQHKDENEFESHMSRLDKLKF